MYLNHHQIISEAQPSEADLKCTQLLETEMHEHGVHEEKQQADERKEALTWISGLCTQWVQEVSSAQRDISAADVPLIKPKILTFGKRSKD